MKTQQITTTPARHTPLTHKPTTRPFQKGNFKNHEKQQQITTNHNNDYDHSRWHKPTVGEFQNHEKHNNSQQKMKTMQERSIAIFCFCGAFKTKVPFSFVTFLLGKQKKSKEDEGCPTVQIKLKAK